MIKNFYTYSVIILALSLISCSKNNSSKKSNSNESAESPPVYGNKDKSIKDANVNQVQPKRKLNGIYVYKEGTNQEKFHLYKFSENYFETCNGNYVDEKPIPEKAMISWNKNNNEFSLISTDKFGSSISFINEEDINNEKITTINYKEDINTYSIKIAKNLSLVKNHEKIIHDCKF